MLPSVYNLPEVHTQVELEYLIKQILDRVQQAHILLCKQSNITNIPPINEVSIISSLALFKIVKLPKIVYQAMWDTGPRNEADREEAKWRGRNVLMEYVKDTFPGHDIKIFADFSNKDATAIHTSFGWGLYIQLEGEFPNRYSVSFDAYKKEDNTQSNLNIYKDNRLIK